MVRILIIDDDELLRDMLHMQLSRVGYSVTTAADAAEGIRALLANDFDLVVSDVEMPYMNGLEMVRAIRGDEKTRHIPVLMLTAHYDDYTWSQAMRLGVKDYLTKPMKGDELIAAIKRILASTARRAS